MDRHNKLAIFRALVILVILPSTQQTTQFLQTGTREWIDLNSVTSPARPFYWALRNGDSFRTWAGEWTILMDTSAPDGVSTDINFPDQSHSNDGSQALYQDTNEQFSNEMHIMSASTSIPAESSTHFNCQETEPRELDTPTASQTPKSRLPERRRALVNRSQNIRTYTRVNAPFSKSSRMAQASTSLIFSEKENHVGDDGANGDISGQRSPKRPRLRDHVDLPPKRLSKESSEITNHENQEFSSIGDDDLSLSLFNEGSPFIMGDLGEHTNETVVNANTQAADNHTKSMHASKTCEAAKDDSQDTSLHTPPSSAGGDTINVKNVPHQSQSHPKSNQAISADHSKQIEDSAASENGGHRVGIKICLSSNSVVATKSRILKAFRDKGGMIVDNLDDCQIFVISKDQPLTKSAKFLRAIVQGKDIVYDSWLVQSAKNNTILPITDYVPRHTHQEELWSCNIETAVERGKQGMRHILKDLAVHITASLKRELSKSYESYCDLALLLGADSVKYGLPSRRARRSTLILGSSNEADMEEVAAFDKNMWSKDLIPFTILRGSLQTTDFSLAVGIPIKREESD
ncbi:hypothetical protein UCRPC4_g01271 [Phaeomoniella chlamydospora]|uniref:BRCT domain-containing protein n=1 Tax=Phaeomoniella chlamydospora TaxID=158046 RepID=A0A0G2EY89_PHACM|nr:hypothetical protein UCRPC4_g01271 [Phaeomoniella chlamydospora]